MKQIRDACRLTILVDEAIKLERKKPAKQQYRNGRAIPLVPMLFSYRDKYNTDYDTVEKEILPYAEQNNYLEVTPNPFGDTSVHVLARGKDLIEQIGFFPLGLYQALWGKYTLIQAIVLAIPIAVVLSWVWGIIKPLVDRLF